MAKFVVQCKCETGPWSGIPRGHRCDQHAGRRISPTMNTPTTASFNLSSHGLTVTEVHRNLSPSKLYEHAIRYREGREHRGQRRARRLLRREDRTLAEGQARGRTSRLEERHLVGAGEHPVRRAHFPNQSRARARLSQHARAALLLRRLRRLGSEVSHQGPRHLLAAVSRALHAHHAHPPDEGGARELRRARLRHLSTPARSPPIA